MLMAFIYIFHFVLFHFDIFFSSFSLNFIFLSPFILLLTTYLCIFFASQVFLIDSGAVYALEHLRLFVMV